MTRSWQEDGFGGVVVPARLAVGDDVGLAVAVLDERAADDAAKVHVLDELEQEELHQRRARGVVRERVARRRRVGEDDDVDAVGEAADRRR